MKLDISTEEAKILRDVVYNDGAGMLDDFLASLEKKLAKEGIVYDGPFEITLEGWGHSGWIG